MVRLLKKTIEFFHDVLQRNVTAANPPPPNEHMTLTKSVCEASLTVLSRQTNSKFICVCAKTERFQIVRQRENDV